MAAPPGHPAARWPAAAVAAALTALCLLLPTRNPSGDAWYYAACARWGQELWQPHHLLYNAVGWAWLRLVGGPGPAAIHWLQALNALAFGGCLLALGALLRRAGVRPAAVPAWLLLVGGCFGMLRFATENETYIQPLLLALLASVAWARASCQLFVGSCQVEREGEEPVENSQLATNILASISIPDRQQLTTDNKQLATNAVLAGLLAAAACLVHQLLVWWWLGLLLGLQPWRRANWGRALAYAAPALLVPLAYWLAAPGGGVLGTVRFALHDYLTGGARVELGLKSLLLTPISLVRTLVQVHGSLLPLLRRWPLALGAAGLLSAALAVQGLWGVVKPKGPRAAPPRPSALPVPDGAARRIRRTHALIGTLQLLFAAQAAGNAEFMVMLPALAAVALAGGPLRAWPPRRVATLGVAVLVWNLATGLLPAHFLALTDTGPALRARALRQPRAWLVLLDPNLLRNQLHYATGRPAAAPRVLGLPAPGQAVAFRHLLLARLAAHDTVYTDALGGSAPPLDRAALLRGTVPAVLLAGLHAAPVDTLPTFFGPRYLSRLTLPPAPASSQGSANAKATATTGASR